MKIRYNRSAKSVTLHIDTREQALKLAGDFLDIAQIDGAFPGTTLVIIEKGPKVAREQQYSDVSLRSGLRRHKK